MYVMCKYRTSNKTSQSDLSRRKAPFALALRWLVKLGCPCSNEGIN